VNLDLRPVRQAPFPLFPFRGMGLTPGYTPAQQAMADAYKAQFGGGGGAAYVAPAAVANPSCLQDAGPGGTAFSDTCQALLHQAQQTRMQLANNANFQVDYTNCVNQGIAPADCASRTYGLTPAGGYTSDAGAGPGGSQLILDANGNPVSGVPVYTGPPLPGGGSNPPAQAAPLSFTFTNLTSGNNGVFQVGDKWQVKISGASPNAPVTVTGGQNGANAVGNTGSTDAQGNFSYNGQITSDQIGSWQEVWKVGPTQVASFGFTVAAPGGSTSTPATGSSTASSFFTGTVSLGGTSVPMWAILAAVGVGIFLMVKR
jgi:hypothetical protein